MAQVVFYKVCRDGALSEFCVARDLKAAQHIWKEKTYPFSVKGKFFARNDWQGRVAIEKEFGKIMTW
jgi:hypothetical protein